MSDHTRYVHVLERSLHRVTDLSARYSPCMSRRAWSDLGRPYFLVMVAVSIVGPALAQSPPAANPALDEAFVALRSLEPGQDLQRFHPIEVVIVQARSDAMARADLEARLVAVLQGDATDLAKDYTCRQLATVGTETAVGAIAPLLTQPRASYMARYALEEMGSAAARQALRDALPLASGPQRSGILVSLGNLADPEAVAAISAHLTDDDPLLRETAYVALGRVGNVAAAQALLQVARQAEGVWTDGLVDAILTAGESLCRRGENTAAFELFELMAAAQDERVRAAGFRGLLRAQPAERIAMILAALGSEESWQREVAADYLLLLTEPDDVAVVAQAIPNLPPAGQIAAFISLRQRPDASVREAAWHVLSQPDTTVQIAALDALIASAQSDDVRALLSVADTAQAADVRHAAWETLRRMTASGTNQVLLSLFAEDQPWGSLLVRTALARRNPDFLPAFFQAAQGDDAATRREALQALEIMASDRDATALVALLSKTPPGEERDAADRAVWMACQQIPDPAERAAPLLAALAQADTATHCALLPTLARLGGEMPREAVQRAMQSTDQTVRDAGYRALANWPDASVADELFEIAKTSDVPSYRTWALRAYARVVSLPSDRSPETTLAMLTGAWELATRIEDKELIISRLAAVRVPESLALLVSLIDQPELREAAIPAVFTAAKGLSQSHPEPARAALEKIQPLTDDPVLLQQIPRVLRDIEARPQNQ